MRKKASRFVLFHKGTGTYFKTLRWRNIAVKGSGTSVYLVQFVPDVGEARILSKSYIDKYLDRFGKYIMIDKNNRNINYISLDLEIKEVQVSYTII
jgi:hypothetical protein